MQPIDVLGRFDLELSYIGYMYVLKGQIENALKSLFEKYNLHILMHKCPIIENEQYKIIRLYQLGVFIK